LLKPHNYEKFCYVMDRVLVGRRKNTIIVKKRSSVEYISYDNIDISKVRIQNV